MSRSMDDSKSGLELPGAFKKILYVHSLSIVYFCREIITLLTKQSGKTGMPVASSTQILVKTRKVIIHLFRLRKYAHSMLCYLLWSFNTLISAEALIKVLKDQKDGFSSSVASKTLEESISSSTYLKSVLMQEYVRDNSLDFAFLQMCLFMMDHLLKTLKIVHFYGHFNNFDVKWFSTRKCNVHDSTRLGLCLFLLSLILCRKRSIWNFLVYRKLQCTS